jgi:hypothetical protein
MGLSIPGFSADATPLGTLLGRPTLRGHDVVLAREKDCGRHPHLCDEPGYADGPTGPLPPIDGCKAECAAALAGCGIGAALTGGAALVGGVPAFYACLGFCALKFPP